MKKVILVVIAFAILLGGLAALVVANPLKNQQSPTKNPQSSTSEVANDAPVPLLL